MKTSMIAFFITALILMCGCEKETAEPQLRVALKNTEVYIHDLKISGDEEGASITKQAQHSAMSALIRNSETNWSLVYKYKPEAGFVGKDYVEIETCTGGEMPCSDYKTIKIEFTVSN